MSTHRLSPAMRKMLRNAIDGAPITRGMGAGALRAGATRDALILRGMLDSECRPTDAGRAVFAPVKPIRQEEAAPC